MSVFAKTDSEERTCETVTKKNAIDFNRAGHFINLLSLCNNGEVSEEWQSRGKYCLYKAGTIVKALKNGEVAARGNPFAPEPEKIEE